MAPIKLTASQAPARRVCVGCDMLAEPQRPGAPLCKHCTAETARARIAARAESAANIVAAAARRYAECLAALSPEERERWHQYDRARKRIADGEALSRALRERLHVATDAMRNAKADDLMGTPGLVALFAADEAHWWAGQEHAHYARRAEEQLAVLEAWVAKQTLQETPA